MAPLKCRVAINFERELSLVDGKAMCYSSLECIHGNKSNNVDSDAGEISLDAWSRVNLRLGFRSSTWTLVCGVDNLFDETYAVANSYEWDVIGGALSDPLIVNEPGRFAYMSIAYHW